MRRLCYITALIITTAITATAQRRFFVSEQQVSSASETQLSFSNKGSREAVVDVWAFSTSSQTFGQAQVRIKPLGAHSMNLSDLFRAALTPKGVWIAAVTRSEELDMSFGVGDKRLNVGHAQALPAFVETPPSGATRKGDFTIGVFVDSQQPVGAFQLMLHYDPKVIRFSNADITGGSAAGFDTKPIAIGIDNDAGLLHLASFQVGQQPSGRLEVARLRVSAPAKALVRFGIDVEEVTDLKGESILQTLPVVRLIAIQ